MLSLQIQGVTCCGRRRKFAAAPRCGFVQLISASVVLCLAAALTPAVAAPILRLTRGQVSTARRRWSGLERHATAVHDHRLYRNLRSCQACLAARGQSLGAVTVASLLAAMCSFFAMQTRRGRAAICILFTSSTACAIWTPILSSMATTNPAPDIQASRKGPTRNDPCQPHFLDGHRHSRLYRGAMIIPNRPGVNP
jgi:hypothetical protein